MSTLDETAFEGCAPCCLQFKGLAAMTQLLQQRVRDLGVMRSYQHELGTPLAKPHAYGKISRIRQNLRVWQNTLVSSVGALPRSISVQLKE